MSNQPQQQRTKQPQSVGSRVEARVAKKKKKSKVKVFFLWFVSIIAIILLAGIAYGAYIITQANKAIDTISIADTIDKETGETKAPIAVGDSVKQKPVTMLLLGLDQRDGGGGLNTDVILIAALNPANDTGAVIAMPRDTRITYDGRTRKANAFYANYYVKAQNNGADKTEAMRQGKEAVKDVFGQFYDIPIQYAVSVNFQGFSDVVDVLGGIEVDVDMRMRYTDSQDGTDIDLQPGLQKLNGKKALDFVRFRKSNTNPNASSDFDRNNRQNVVISAILKKMISLGGITKIDSVIKEVSEDVHTDMPKQEIERMITTYFDVKMENITFMSLQGTWQNPYVVADEQSLDEAKQLLQSILAE